LLWPVTLVTCLLAQINSLEQGRELFHGERPLIARLGKESDPLPAMATICVNCHGRHARGGREAGVDVASLSWRRLVRQKGYNETSFCQTMRTGIDPGGVLLSVAMPRYDIATDACQALWFYLQHLEQATLFGISDEVITIALISNNPNLEGMEILEKALTNYNLRGFIWGRQLRVIRASTPPPNAGILIYLTGKPKQGDTTDRLVVSWQDETPQMDAFVISPSLSDQAKAALATLPKDTQRLIYDGLPSPWSTAWAEAAEYAGISVSSWSNLNLISACSENSGKLVLVTEQFESIPTKLRANCSSAFLFFQRGAGFTSKAGWSSLRISPARLDSKVASLLAETIAEALDASGRKLLLNEIQSNLSNLWRSRSGEPNRLLRGVWLENKQQVITWSSMTSDQ
jgi:hypothetical protein